MKDEEIQELLYQALETELGGVQVYTTALRCAVNEDLKEEWEEYLEQTQNHVRIMEEVFSRLELDPEGQTPGRLVVRHIGQSLVKAMKMALEGGKPEEAQLVAAECVVLAETKDHLNWELIGEFAKKAKGEMAAALKEAHEEVEEEEDEHLYHTHGWTRELWIETLGMPAVLPPPEEEKDVKTAIGAARAKRARKTVAPRKTRRKGLCILERSIDDPPPGGPLETLSGLECDDAEQAGTSFTQPPTAPRPDCAHSATVVRQRSVPCWCTSSLTMGQGDLAFSEVVQRIRIHLPDAEVVLTPVPAFSTLAAGFCIAQLGLNEAPPGTLIYHNVAPRADDADPRPENAGERLSYARLPTGVRVIGVAHAGHTLALIGKKKRSMAEFVGRYAGWGLAIQIT